MKKIINLLKILSDENRFRILYILKEKSLCVCEILELLNISGATLSAHLKILKLSGIVDQKKDGRWIEYALIDQNIIKFLDIIEDFIDDKTKIIEDKEKIKSLNKREIISQKKNI